MKHTNPGEAITLRNNISKAEKALTISILNRWAYTAKANEAAVKANSAEEALKKADPKKDNYNDVAKAYHDASAALSAAVDVENKAWADAAKAEADLTAAKAKAKAAYAI